MARYSGVRFLRSPRGRGSQMNHGAAQATGDILWFLHADCQAPPDAGTRIREALGDPGVALGSFRFAVDSPRFVFRLLEFGVRARTRWLRTPYGDQGLFLGRRRFEALGGYPEIPVMEDLYLVRKARDSGRLVCLERDLPTSDRRWRQRGFLRTSLRNWALVLGDWLGFQQQAR